VITLGNNIEKIDIDSDTYTVYFRRSYDLVTLEKQEAILLESFRSNGCDLIPATDLEALMPAGFADTLRQLSLKGVLEVRYRCMTGGYKSRLNANSTKK
jgi:hypothetical protein